MNNKKIYAGATALTVVAVGGYLYYRHVTRALQQEDAAWTGLLAEEKKRQEEAWEESLLEEQKKKVNTWGQPADQPGEEVERG